MNSKYYVFLSHRELIEVASAFSKLKSDVFEMIRHKLIELIFTNHWLEYYKLSLTQEELFAIQQNLDELNLGWITKNKFKTNYWECSFPISYVTK